MEVYLGFHYYAGSFRRTDSSSDRVSSDDYLHHGDLFGGDNRAISFGVRIGGLFTKKGIGNKKSIR